jgi:hypothetical protein
MIQVSRDEPICGAVCDEPRYMWGRRASGGAVNAVLDVIDLLNKHINT